MSDARKKILIIGAGPGGLTAGMILASRGFDVHIFEKEKIVGGRNAEIVQDGFIFDVGPTFLMLKDMLDDVFARSGESSEDYMRFTRLNHMYQLAYEDFNFDVYDDAVRMKAEIKKHFPGEEAGFDRFMARESVRFEKIKPFLARNYTSVRDFLDLNVIKTLPQIPLGKSLFEYLGNYFKAEKLRLAFTFQAKYIGMSPFACPAFFVILSYIEHAFGIYHVEGGLSKISKAMAAVVEKKGGTIHLNSPVSQVLLEGKKAVGVTLKNGEKVYADEVVLNADFAHAATHLFPEGVLKKYSPEKIAKKGYSCSTFMIYLGIKGEYPDMKHHTIMFAKEYRKNVERIFKTLEVSEDFSFYVRNASVTDKTVAPEGMTNIYILVPVPNNASNIDWNKEKETFKNIVLNEVEKRTPIKNIREHIVTEKIITPLDWEASGVYRGAVFSMAHSLDQMLMFRPHNKFEEIDQMYLVGGGTHPGSGLPTIYQSGMIAADLISEKYDQKKD